MFGGKGGYAVQREFEEYAKALADASRKQQQAKEVAEKKAEENKKNGKSVKKTQHSGKKSNTNISQNARRSTKNIK